MKDDFHVDMSGRIYEGKTIGIAVVGTEKKTHFGCALKGNLIKLIKKYLFQKNIFEDSAKLYAICIFLLVRDLKEDIKRLIICNDEDFEVVKKTLEILLKGHYFEITDISEFRKKLGRNVGSSADNYARVYRKRGLNPKKWNKGKKLNVVPVTFGVVKKYWKEIN